MLATAGDSGPVEEFVWRGGFRRGDGLLAFGGWGGHGCGTVVEVGRGVEAWYGCGERSGASCWVKSRTE